MEQVVQPESAAHLAASERTPPLLFLDSNVIVEYLRGDPTATQLFSAEAKGRVQFAVNPIVLQELLLSGHAASRPEFERIRDLWKVLPVDYAKAQALIARVRALNYRIAHSNELLIVSSADECDYLVTKDPVLKTLVTREKPQVVTPEEMLAQLLAA
jgi:predicted nucleic acid-binding protein